MIDHSHSPGAARRQHRPFSLAQQGLTVRLLIAAGFIIVIWAAILPLVA